MRENIIEAILEYGGDEYETREDLIELAKTPTEELVKKLIYLIEYYHSEVNN